MHATAATSAVALALAAGAGATLCWLCLKLWTREEEAVRDGVLALIGNTPLVRIASLSEATGCEILAKAEMLNPGGSVKDRVALQVVREALADGRLARGGLITEGTAGSTGVSLAMVAAALGCRCSITMPDDAAIEKAQMIQAYGATVRRVRPVSIVHPEHPVNVARKEAADAVGAVLVGRTTSGGAGSVGSSPYGSGLDLRSREGAGAGPGAAESSGRASPAGASGQPGGQAADGVDGAAAAATAAAAVAESGERGAGAEGAAGAASTSGRGEAGKCTALFADQFETAANYRAHLQTGDEIWHQTRGRVHAFVSGAGTGGTIAGVSRSLKKRNPHVKVYLIDPLGSSLFNKVKRGVMYTHVEAEGKRLKNPFDTITEGIGINRLTANFNEALIDDAFRGTDREAVEMSHYLLRHEGLWVGSSAAMNCVGAVKAARALGPGHTIVTVLCDGGHRHLSKFHSPAYLQQHGLSPQHQGSGLEFVV